MKAAAYQPRHWRRQSGLVSVLALILVSSVVSARADDDENEGGFWDRMGSSVGNTFKNAGKAVGLGKPAPPPQAESPSGCPSIEILDGTGAQRVSANAAAGNAGVKYQYSITDVARQCWVNGNSVTVKVGVEGKVLLGPEGAPGAFDVPVRVAIVTQSDQKPVMSKLYKAGASIASGQTSTPYSLVADSIVIPLGNHTATDFGIKIGIDTVGKGDVAAKPARHRKAKHPEATASQ